MGIRGVLVVLAASVLLLLIEITILVPRYATMAGWQQTATWIVAGVGVLGLLVAIGVVAVRGYRREF